MISPGFGKGGTWYFGVVKGVGDTELPVNGLGLTVILSGGDGQTGI